MAEFKRPASEKDFDVNFGQIKPLMNDTEAFYESARCLFCYDAPCVKSCPTSIDIPLFIRQIHSDSPEFAAKTIYDSNVFGYACGKVCPTEILCEGACVYNHSDVKPIEIGRLQTYATHKAIQSVKKMYSLKKSTGKKVAVIGAGPAGISCACELSKEGIQVDIYEASEKPSGLTIHGVAPYKITNEEVLSEMDYLQKQFKFNVLYENLISTKSDVERLEKEYNAIFIGIGLGETSELFIPGENLINVFGAVEFVNDLRRLHHNVKVPNKIIVLGGGNTAMDAAGECARMGAEEVQLCYRRTKEEMGAYNFEFELVKRAGVKTVFSVSPIEIIGNSTVAGVKFANTKTENGVVTIIPDSEYIESCDWVIKATGQSKKIELLNLLDIQMTNRGTIKVDEKFKTSREKYFSAGDAVSGGEEVVNAVANGKKSARSIIELLA